VISGLFALVAVVLIVVFALAVITSQKGRQPTSKGEEFSFDARKELLSPAERSFFGVLEQAISGEFKVFSKVRLGDLIQPARGLPQGRRTSLRNRIQQKHVDFVLCHPDSLAVVGAVELDDSSHGRKDRADRDDFVDRALTSAAVPILRFPARKGYAVPEVRAKLTDKFELKGAEVDPPESVVEEKTEHENVTPPPEQSMKVETLPEEEVAPVVEKTALAEEPSAPNCPACNVPMVKRQAKKGPKAGQWFWACPGFPKCRKVLAIRD